VRTYPNFRDLERIYNVTWRDLAEREPRLEELLWAARQAGVSCRRWSDADRLFAPIRRALAELIGFGGKHHRHRVLGGHCAYEVAYWALFDAVAGLLPDRAGEATVVQETQRQETAAERCARVLASLATARA
jgi:hypothetical protein